MTGAATAVAAAASMAEQQEHHLAATAAGGEIQQGGWKVHLLGVDLRLLLEGGPQVRPEAVGSAQDVEDVDVERATMSFRNPPR